MTQRLEHPSPLLLFPSSHYSPRVRYPLPQTLLQLLPTRPKAIVQLVHIIVVQVAREQLLHSEEIEVQIGWQIPIAIVVKLLHIEQLPLATHELQPLSQREHILDTLLMQKYVSSMVHEEEHPSPSTLLWSSHASDATIMPSPHIGPQESFVNERIYPVEHSRQTFKLFDKVQFMQEGMLGQFIIHLFITVLKVRFPWHVLQKVVLVHYKQFSIQAVHLLFIPSGTQ